jgi:hypothetical protein
MKSAILSTIVFAGMVSVNLANNVQSIWDGNWGQWKNFVNAPSGYYACGATLRVEPPQGKGDDTAANGLKLVWCKSDNWDLQDEQSIFDGNWGNWGNKVMCPRGQFINGG